MPVFLYKAIQVDGTIAEGQIEAGGRQEAFRQMEGRGLRPISLAEHRNGKPRSAEPNGEAQKMQKATAEKADRSAAPFQLSLGGSNRIPARVLENFTRLLSSLLAAGVPLSRALVILTKEASAPVARAKWKEIHDLVVDGMSLADAMAKSPDTFPRVYVAMVEAGETGGFLDVVLGQIADFQTREEEMRSKVMAAMIYPAILLGLALCVLVFLLVFFIPRFQTIFAGFGAKLPLLTQMIVGASHFMRSYGLFILIGLGVVAFMIRNWI